MIAGLYYLPLYFQSVLMATPLESGTFILPITLTSALSSALSGILIHRTGTYTPSLYLGAIFLVLGSVSYTFLNAQTPLELTFFFQIITGIGAGALFAPPLLALQAGVKNQGDIAMATSMFGFVRNMSAATSIVVGGTVFQNRMTVLVRDLATNGLNSAIAETFDSVEAAAAVETIRDIADNVQRLRVRETYAKALGSCWILYAGLAGVVVLACFGIQSNILTTYHEETKTGLAEMDKASKLDDEDGQDCEKSKSNMKESPS